MFVWMMLIFLTCARAAAQFQAQLPTNPFPVPTLNNLKATYKIAFALGLRDTSITLRLGQYFQFTERIDTTIYRHIVRFDSVRYNGGGNTRTVLMSLRAIDYPPPGDSTRSDSLGYEMLVDEPTYTGWGGKEIRTSYNGFTVTISLQKIINIGFLSIAKLRVTQHGTMVDSIAVVP